MRYDTQQTDRLAAEYVLGTLQGNARRRFERLMMERADVRMAVWRWEGHLNDLAGGLEPRKPPQRVWGGIQQRIQGAPASKTRFWNWRTLWTAIPSAITAVLLVLVLLPAPETQRMAIFADQNAQALWVISADLDQRVLQTEAVHAQAADTDKSYELWVLPVAGPPQSLGLLRIGSRTFEIAISTQLAAALTSAGSLAISLEPKGGSTTGLPTGPVIYQATLVSI